MDQPDTAIASADDTSEIEELRREVGELRQLVASMATRERAVAVAESAPTEDAGVDASLPDPASRRHVFKLAAGAAAAGAVAAVGTGSTAAAADSDSVDVGGLHSGTISTEIAHTGDDKVGFLVHNLAPGEVRFESFAFYNALVAGYALASAHQHGVYGYTDQTGGAGVIGRSDHAGSSGLRGVNDQAGGTAVSGTASGQSGVSIRGVATGTFGGAVSGIASGDAATGVYGQADGVNGRGINGFTSEVTAVAMRANHDGGGTGLEALGGTAVLATGEEIGVVGSGSGSTSLGAELSGERAALRVVASGPAPAGTAIAHEAGEIYADTDGDLWFCTKGGTPGTWVNLLEPPPIPRLPSVLYPVAPFRTYDSRFEDGPLGVGAGRVVSVKDAIDLGTGAVTASDVVPPDATAVTFNLTIVGTVSAGFVATAPGDASTFATSSINWAGPGVVLANGTMVQLDGSRQMKVFVDGAPDAQTDFIVDITGYLA
ncbi:MAG: hypothetical protein QNJ12_03790 [Ilumatobacter sp.]|uniref:hypothetical protein n=1 Tax=Ilumatobacter sp. TaxID=1967498 RepID=UPI00263339D3|nr:hypothetical protein [Ilumatobacter sp.]MDJ0767884.1 hypothetical protein [Ilumatobacter sp.]